MRAVNCKGSPYEVCSLLRSPYYRTLTSSLIVIKIGIQHGKYATTEIQGSLAFYKALFQKTCAMKWPQVCETAVKFVPYLEKSWPWYMDEMKGGKTISPPFFGQT